MARSFGLFTRFQFDYPSYRASGLFSN